MKSARQLERKRIEQEAMQELSVLRDGASADKLEAYLAYIRVTQSTLGPDSEVFTEAVKGFRAEIALLTNGLFGKLDSHQLTDIVDFLGKFPSDDPQLLPKVLKMRLSTLLGEDENFKVLDPVATVVFAKELLDELKETGCDVREMEDQLNRHADDVILWISLGNGLRNVSIEISELRKAGINTDGFEGIVNQRKGRNEERAAEAL